MSVWSVQTNSASENPILINDEIDVLGNSLASWSDRSVGQISTGHDPR
ncbi:hypothetical protein POX_e06346 [Penicillium oxalicum]|uniref:Uncharacterized protein n=1 Tax=Penicillium oxalicum (strain 114-2 / CGMCC 5302) TaxID=933388 RepID=S8AZF7_PENO1|nr:hypothetical protein POX_e06346 [Penicillium oxalicum]EPS27377.1 hypothetical protein PDE_02320 [Penicillium oxalicum 114-2]KAI2788332.1 hypothetical protein POX_e06346 [Penicillium oxalicum]